MIRLWDFATCACGQGHRDTAIDGERIPETILCACGASVGWVGEDEGYMRKNQINLTAAGMKYGEFDPQFGCVVEDYNHRQRLLKERGMVEISGPERRDDIENDAPEEAEGNPLDVGVSASESDEDVVAELTQKLYSDPRVHREHTGQARERMIDETWMEFEP